eukprot:350708-Chlamydomonas_euryale.AAC.10
MCSPALSHTGPIILRLSHTEFRDLLSYPQPSKGLPSAMQPVIPSLLLLHGASLLQQGHATLMHSAMQRQNKWLLGI